MSAMQPPTAPRLVVVLCKLEPKVELGAAAQHSVRVVHPEAALERQRIAEVMVELAPMLAMLALVAVGVPVQVVLER